MLELLAMARFGRVPLLSFSARLRDHTLDSEIGVKCLEQTKWGERITRMKGALAYLAVAVVMVLCVRADEKTYSGIAKAEDLGNDHISGGKVFAGDAGASNGVGGDREAGLFCFQKAGWIVRATDFSAVKLDDCAEGDPKFT